MTLDVSSTFIHLKDDFQVFLWRQIPFSFQKGV